MGEPFETLIAIVGGVVVTRLIVGGRSLPRRFGMRALLFGYTLVAVALGMIVALAR
jgi:hypothetical protein